MVSKFSCCEDASKEIIAGHDIDHVVLYTALKPLSSEDLADYRQVIMTSFYVNGIKTTAFKILHSAIRFHLLVTNQHS